MSAYDEHLRQQVFATLQTAVEENGYAEILTWDVQRITADLLDCDAGLEGADASDVERHVKAFLAELKGKQDDKATR